MRFQAQKMKELVLYIAQAQKDDETFGRVKLAKLLYFCDFEAYGNLGASITGADYQKLPWGPGARQFLAMKGELLASGEADEASVDAYGYTQGRLVAHRPADTSLFTHDELLLVDKIVASYEGVTGTDISNESHNEMGWRVARERERIPYEAVFIAPEVPASVLDRARELSVQYGWAASYVF